MIKEKIFNLINAINKSIESDSVDEKEELYTFVVDTTNKYVQYVNSVIIMELEMALYQGIRFDDPEKYKDKIIKLDTNRKQSHDIAISSCNQLNRLCETVNVDKICDFDTSDRYKVADFIGNFINEMYNEGIKKRNITLDDVTHNKDKLYKELKKEDFIR